MPHPASFRAALRAVATVLVALVLAALAVLPGLAPAVATPALGAQARTAATDALVVHIDAISPVLPRKGNVEISGTVTNTTGADFTRINLHAFSSPAPIPDATALAESAATPADAYVGQRVCCDVGTFATVETLLPGQTASFSLAVPVELLGTTGEPGVYWVGVHALGDGVEARDVYGRARTFVPVLPRGDARIEGAVILPLRGRVWYRRDGSLGGTERWARRLAEGGRLDTSLDIADAAAGHAYTWLVDPAILAAVKRLAAGNLPRSLAPDPDVPDPNQPDPPPEEPDAGTPTESTETITPPSGTSEEPAEPSAEEVALATAALAWLERFKVTTAGRPVLALPYGDLDVSAAMRHRPERFEQARTRSAEVMGELGISSTPALAPENDVLTSEAMLETPEETTILLGDTAFASPPATDTSTVQLLGHRVVVTSTGAQAGGPAPTRADDPLAMRQRLISEAALRLTAGSTAPVVVTLPSGWSPEDAGALFSAFDEPWLRSVSVVDVAARKGAKGVPGSALTYTEADVAGELGAANFLAVDRLAQAAALLEEVLARQTRLEQQVRDEALVTLSQQHRLQPRGALRSAAGARERLVDLLGRIRIDPPRKVILSSDAGRVGATIVNGLDQPVTVKVVATSDGEMTLVGPEVLELAPGSRSLVRFQARAERPGVHNVRLAVTSASGTALGSSARIPIRAAQVSGLIWVVMAAGASLLLSAAGLRVWREVRARRRTDGLSGTGQRASQQQATA